MNICRLAGRSLLLVLVFGIGTACADQESEKEAAIAGVIEGGNAVRSDVLRDSGGAFADYKVYRDGQADGVVFKYVFAENVEIDRSQLNPEVIKPALKGGLAADPSIREVLEMGIYLKFLYMAHDGEVLCEVRLTADDF